MPQSLNLGDLATRVRHSIRVHREAGSLALRDLQNAHVLIHGNVEMILAFPAS